MLRYESPHHIATVSNHRDHLEVTLIHVRHTTVYTCDEDGHEEPANTEFNATAPLARTLALRQGWSDDGQHQFCPDHTRHARSAA